jgi:3-dehydroquinate synthase
VATVAVALADRSYEIRIGSGTLGAVGDACRKLDSGMRLGPKAAVVTNPTVAARYLAPVTRSLEKAGFQVSTFEVPDGERHKHLRWITRMYDHMVGERFDRSCFLVALGGGVVGDMAGFAAATYLRGVPFVQVPTTVVAQVDSSVGGKTGVNHPSGKNLIGAFHQPRLVQIDLDVLSTLPRRELLAGIAEVVKYGVIADASFFAYLDRHADKVLALDPKVLSRVVKRCCEIKAEVVAEDEREVSGRRAILNYGHTVGHALEAVTRYRRYKHGEAVAVGMVAAARMAVALGALEADAAAAVERLLSRFGLPTALPPRVSREGLLEAMGLDKKAKAGRIHMILPDRIGHVDLVALAPREVAGLLADL